jgi:hypothetical protein
VGLHHQIRFAVFALIFFPATAVLYTNCSPFESSMKASSSSGEFSASLCPIAPAGMNHLETIDDTIALINSLPKPLTLDCFIENLEKPLSVHAVNNANSAQPAVNAHNPRILILKDPLILTVIPAGAGRQLLEMGEIVSASQSVKAELEFPIVGEIVSEDAFSRMAATVGGGSDCRFCHAGESAAGAGFPTNAFKNDIVRPSEAVRITSSVLRREATSCDPSVDAYRCAILKAVFIDGAAFDGVFP